MTGRIFRRYDLVLAVALFLVAIPAQYLEWLGPVEDATVSYRHQLRFLYGAGKADALAQSLAKDVLIVTTDEAFFNAYKSFPLRRTDIAKIIANLKDLGAKVIAVDMLMDFPSSYGEDPALANALHAAGNTLLVSQADVRKGRIVKINYPTATLDQASASAYTNIEPTNTWVTSMSRLRIHPEATSFKNGWPFAVAAAAMYLGVEPKLEPGMLRLGDLTVPLDRNNHIYIDFPPLPGGTRFLSQTSGQSALQFLDIDENDRNELEMWVKDKIVVLGDTSEVSHDWFDTPVGNVYGVEIIADVITTILRGGPLHPVGPAAEVASVLAMMVLVLAIALLLKTPLWRAVAVTAVLAGFVGVTSALYVRQGLIVPVSYILLAAMLSHLTVEFRQYMIERAQKRQIAKTFGQYIPEELVKEMSRTGEEVSVGGESREMTVLFSDVRGFTTISEGLAPQELTTLMNAFLSPMTRVIHQHRGTIDKYMGDAIMAFWGAPLTDSDHARHAVAAALAMTRTMNDLASDFVARGWKPIKIGIGLNSGVMNVGNMGSDFRLAYTVLGDAVNLGSRVESLTKQYGVGCMITEYTQAKVPDLISREIDLVRVKGKDTPVRLFEPLGFDGDVDAETVARLQRHAAAVLLFRGQSWAEAEAAFEALAAEEPERMVYRVYLDRIRHFREDPPGAAWDGVYTHKEK